MKDVEVGRGAKIVRLFLGPKLQMETDKDPAKEKLKS